MITTILIVGLILLILRTVINDFRSSNPLEEQEKDETVLAGKFTPQTLAKYNGPYANFAGRDASRGLALNSFEESCLTPLDEPIDDLKGLTKEELESLENWEDHFENKYKVVGTLGNE